MTRGPLIIGDPSDSHVVAVTQELHRIGQSPFLCDAPSLQSGGFSLRSLQLRNSHGETSLDGGRGWLRRYAPNMWMEGTAAGSLEGVTSRAFLGLVGSISRLGAVEWLTPLDSMLRAEDRLLQLQVVAQTGSRVPETIVTSDADEAFDLLGPRFVVKPLVGGLYQSDAGAFAVYASEFAESDRGLASFASAPFVAQERIEVLEHLRVVTVGTSAWVAVLDAAGRPLDWRRQERAHFEWRPADEPDVRDAALEVSGHLGIGYSSQDWVRDMNGFVFLDLNPGGQWLFLPEAIARPATVAIAEFLAES